MDMTYFRWMKYQAISIIVLACRCTGILFDNSSLDCNSSIFLDKQSFKDLTFTVSANSFSEITKNDLICTYNFKSFINFNALRITLSYTDFLYPICAFEKIIFLTGPGDLPVKELSCNDTGKWIIPWPWNYGVMITKRNPMFNDDIQFNGSVSISTIKEKLKVTSRNLIEWRKPAIKIPGDRVHQLCIDDAPHYYKVRYRTDLRDWLDENERLRRIKLQIKGSTSICIKTDVMTYEYRICPWKVEMRNSTHKLMTIECTRIRHFWCLPWKHIGESIEIKWKNISMFSRFTLHIATNGTTKSISDCVKRQKEKTTPYRGTWDIATPFNNDYQNEPSDVGQVSIVIIAVVSSLIVLFCLSVIFFKRYKHRYPSHRLDLYGDNGNILEQSSRFIVAGDGTTYDRWNPTDELERMPVRQTYTTRDTSETLLHVFNPRINEPHLNESNTSVLPPNPYNTTAPPPSYEEAVKMTIPTE